MTNLGIIGLNDNPQSECIMKALEDRNQHRSIVIDPCLPPPTQTNVDTTDEYTTSYFTDDPDPISIPEQKLNRKQRRAIEHNKNRNEYTYRIS
jgi:hypothetical protein